MGIDAPLLGASGLDEIHIAKARRTIMRLAGCRHDCPMLNTDTPADDCGHPDHDADLKLIIEPLEAAGLIPDPPSGRRSRIGAAVPRTIRCPTCGRQARIRNDGKIGHHERAGGDVCPARGMPLEGVSEAAS